MTEIMRATPVSQLASEFDDFLFAPIGREDNGMQLSVLSALARSNLDAWEEAAELARLSTDRAIQRLSALLFALPDETTVGPEPQSVAARLIALLPHSNCAQSRVLGYSLGMGKMAISRDIKIMIGFVIFAFFVVAAQLVLVNYKPLEPVDYASAPARTTDVTQEPAAQR